MPHTMYSTNDNAIVSNSRKVPEKRQAKSIGVNLAIYQIGTEVLKKHDIGSKNGAKFFPACYALSHFKLYDSWESAILTPTCGGKSDFILVIY